MRHALLHAATGQFDCGGLTVLEFSSWKRHIQGMTNKTKKSMTDAEQKAEALAGWDDEGGAPASGPSLRHSVMTDVDANIVEFQCPQCGHVLRQTIRKLKSQDQMRCPGCGIGINIDTNRLSRAVDEIQRAVEKVPPQITIKFFR